MNARTTFGSADVPNGESPAAQGPIVADAAADKTSADQSGAVIVGTAPGPSSPAVPARKGRPRMAGADDRPRAANRCAPHAVGHAS